MSESLSKDLPATLWQLWPERFAPHWPTQPINQLVRDSRHVHAGDVFFALQGTTQATRMAEFIQSALAQGAVAVFSEVAVGQFGQPFAHQFANQPVFFIEDLRQWIGVLAQRWLQNQQAVHLPQIAAVTGTNGKTTVTRLLAELLHLAGFASAVMGTTGNGILPHIEPSTHTTVDAIHLQQQLYQYGQQGAQYACLEASSHGLEQGRLAGTPIEVAIFTNLTRDHLDYHGTLQHYAEAKARLFAFPSLKHIILNADDAASAMMRDTAIQAEQRTGQETGQGALIWTYSLHDASADFYVQQVQYSLSGATISLNTPHGSCSLHSPLLGHFNVANLLAAVAGALAFGLSLTQIQQFVPLLQGAPGRMQVVKDQSRLFVVDYAHTPDALTQVLDSLKHHVSGEGQLWAVFGCGGDRDRGKRPLMTQAALALADQVLLTADNPRSEAVQQILDDMLAGVSQQQCSKLQVEADRRLAIRQVVEQAQAQDIVVIAGKGHENYQEIDGVRHWFDDVVELKAALGLRGTSPTGYPA
ncbi:MAG: UDP-N-acetylmuramoyl-L-alanyl-D-glutamate--2,6-diaminopimelate ligase [Moraxellaceae bacterium]|nr:MAG: UDP-N-acetylmuramoyl-L-alanyl-D-glutamate--2,6-diaminopimelate ligase [Moraxellaceae bacterium]